MVLRILWNFGVGAVHRAVTKTTAKAGGGVLYPIVWRGRTGFLDCLVNKHLNHASYLSMMELARWHYAGVIGLLPLFPKKPMVFLAAANAIRYRHPIPPFTSYEVQTRIIHWDDEWMYFLQQFVSPSSGLVYAEGLCRATVKVGRSRVPMREIYREATGLDVEPHKNEMPPAVQELLKWDAASRESMETAEAQAAALVTAKKPVRDLWGKLTLTWNSPFRKLE